jgi:pyrroline-5-carboxylate reductase
MLVSEVLCDKSRWTKGAQARNADGESVWADGEDACCFCVAGAISIVFKSDRAGWTRFRDALATAAGITADGLILWNDTATYTKVIRAVKKAEKQLEKQHAATV